MIPEEELDSNSLFPKLISTGLSSVRKINISDRKIYFEVYSLVLTKNHWTHTQNFKKSNQITIHHTPVEIMVKTNPNTAKTIMTSGCVGRQGSSLKSFHQAHPMYNGRFEMGNPFRSSVRRCLLHFRVRNRERKWI